MRLYRLSHLHIGEIVNSHGCQKAVLSILPCLGARREHSTRVHGGRTVQEISASSSIPSNAARSLDYHLELRNQGPSSKELQRFWQRQTVITASDGFAEKVCVCRCQKINRRRDAYSLFIGIILIIIHYSPFLTIILIFIRSIDVAAVKCLSLIHI